MMYFCPCPCNSAIDPETEESSFLALPRNLSYVQESYLDRHSVSSRFVHNPKVDLAQQFEEKQLYRGVPDLDYLQLGEEKSDRPNIVWSQEFPICSSPPSELQFQSPSSASPISSPIAFTATPQTNASKLESPSETSPLHSHDTDSSSTGSFMSRVAASRLATFLSPKEEPSAVPSNYDQDFSSSVDQPLSPTATTEITWPDHVTTITPTTAAPLSFEPAPAPAQIHSPAHRGLKMDRGECVESSPQNNPHQAMLSTSIVPLNAAGLTHNGEDMSGTVEVKEEDELLTFVVKDSDNSLHVNMDSTANDEGENGFTNGPHSGTETMVCPKKEHRGLKISPPLTFTQTSDGTQNDNGTTNSFESPDSDAFSEEGVFVNMTDDLDTAEKSNTVSEVSDDTCVSVDSMFLSPNEEELGEEKVEKSKEDQQPPRMSVEEAISRAASDLSKMSMMMYSNILNPTLSSSTGQDTPTGDHPKLERTSSLTRQSKELTIRLSYDNLTATKTTSSEDELLESPVYEEMEFNFNRKGLRKSSSLKTNKTPPGTPHRKKVVRFADAMGLDLESVRHVLNMESPPRIPASAMADLKQGLGEDRKDIGLRYLTPCFKQPGACEGFRNRVMQQKICLENAIITDLTITGFVRVANISFNKSVRVRYTHNDWATFHDIAASYVLNSCDGPTDRFSFSIVAPAYFVTGNRLQFAVSFNAEGAEYWDSNGGANYAFECFAKPIPIENETSWMHFL